MNDRMDVNRLLVEMRAIKQQTSAFGGPDGLAAKDRITGGEGLYESGKVKSPEFGDIMSQAVNKVNDVQQASSSMAEAYVRGDQNIDVTDVMIASQKAGVAFDAMVQVRNKLVEAYRDVMNMPI
ncbi:flagellar hook-basal body complex protein FliE [Teredinibacter franksiae]|jgi:flagellar hook-basal body complex protein FliE|uniref:flagellar hook-basal body complex protein FliE n=1 Tax=Teredinibacter franksiae TaxID=2761453 RepID=UPI0016278003|nr:flagellar hook-basal body complex protein FliE [Teredinibacter franksiae]